MGAVQTNAIELPPPVAEIRVGGVGAVIGIVVVIKLLISPLPTVFTATIFIVYCVPFVSAVPAEFWDIIAVVSVVASDL